MRAAAARDEEAKDRRVNTARLARSSRQLLIGRISDVFSSAFINSACQ